MDNTDDLLSKEFMVWAQANRDISLCLGPPIRGEYGWSYPIGGAIPAEFVDL